MLNYESRNNSEEFTNFLMDDSLLEEEENETLHINELHFSLSPKFFPLDSKTDSSIIKSSDILPNRKFPLILLKN